MLEPLQTWCQSIGSLLKALRKKTEFSVRSRLHAWPITVYLGYRLLISRSGLQRALNSSPSKPKSRQLLGKGGERLCCQRLPCVLRVWTLPLQSYKQVFILWASVFSSIKGKAVNLEYYFVNQTFRGFFVCHITTKSPAHKLLTKYLFLGITIILCEIYSNCNVFFKLQCLNKMF